MQIQEELLPYEDEMEREVYEQAMSAHNTAKEIYGKHIWAATQELSQKGLDSYAEALETGYYERLAI